MAPRKDLDISTFAEPDDVILGKKENPGSNDIALVYVNFGPMVYNTITYPRLGL
jgi:hypothetical protein